MTRVLRPMFGMISYFFEKYLGADCLIWTILVMAFCTSFMSVILVGAVKAIWKKDIRLMGASMALCTAVSYPVRNLMEVTFTWVSKLQRAMSNFLYVLSFDSSRKLFLEALDLPDNEYNQERLFRIALSLNDSQWEAVLDNAGDSAWYYGKVMNTIYGINHFAGQDLTQNPNWAVTILLLLGFCIPGIFFILKKDYFSGVVVMICAILAFLWNFGTGIFMLVSICFCIILWRLMKVDRWNLRRKRRRQKGPGDGEGNKEEIDAIPSDELAGSSAELLESFLPTPDIENQ